MESDGKYLDRTGSIWQCHTAAPATGERFAPTTSAAHADITGMVFRKHPKLYSVKKMSVASFYLTCMHFLYLQTFLDKIDVDILCSF